MPREISVFVDDDLHKFGLIYESQAYDMLTHPSLMRALEHAITPEVGPHRNDADPLCPVCNLHNETH